MKRFLRSKHFSALLILMVLCAVFATSAFAGADSGGGGEFSPIYQWLKDAIKGILGRLIALIMIVTGVAMGVARGSIFAFVTGICAGIGFFYIPDILEALTGASLIV